MGHGVGLNLFRSPENGPFGEIRRVGQKAYNRKFNFKSEKSTKISLIQLRRSFSEIFRITGISYLSQSDIDILLIEAQDRERFYQCPRKQEEQIPASSLRDWEGHITDSSRDLAERLFERPFRVSVSPGPSWGDLLNTAPPTTVLMKGGT